jgi:hypothetical protein
MARASHELALNLRQQISERHAENIAIDDEVREILLRKLNCVREAGILVEEAKANLSQQQFAEIAKDVPLASLQAYLAFSRLHADGPITELEKGMKSMRALTLALQTGGLLPFSDGHGVQHLNQPPSFIPELIRAAALFAHKLRHHLKSHPLSEWEPSDIEAALAALQPVLSIDRQLRMFLDKRQ